jgi:hypothetical protein
MDPWVPMGPMGAHGIHGHSIILSVPMESMVSHGIYEYPWNPRVPMECTGAHGIHEKRGGGRDMGSAVARRLGGSGRVCGLRKGKREELGWDGVRQLGGVRAGAVEWSSGGYPSILECIPMY